jgi:hypothetical protein
LIPRTSMGLVKNDRACENILIRQPRKNTHDQNRIMNVGCVS